LPQQPEMAAGSSNGPHALIGHQPVPTAASSA
jgi:hypothetical protein